MRLPPPPSRPNPGASPEVSSLPASRGHSSPTYCADSSLGGGRSLVLSGKVSPGKDSLPALSNTTLHSHGGNFPLLEPQCLSCYFNICLLLSEYLKPLKRKMFFPSFLEHRFRQKWGQKAQSGHMLVSSAVSGSLRPRGLKPARLLCPWDSPGTECHINTN